MKKKMVAIVAVLVALTTLASFSAYAATGVERWNYSRNLRAPKMSDVSHSIALVGDTQVLTAYDAETPVTGKGKAGQSYVKNLYKWIVDNKEEKKIEFVMGLGDITQHSAWHFPNANANDVATAEAEKAYLEPEWNVAKEAIDQLNGVIPYNQIRGNHDNKEYFNKTFNTDAYMGQFDSYYEDPDIDYEISPASTSYPIQIGQEKYLFITLDFGPTDDILEWASEQIEKYPDHKVIISTHGYMDNDGQVLSTAETTIWNGSTENGVGDCNHGVNIQRELVRKYKNVFMVICGHIGTHCPQITEFKGEKGNTVYQVLVNPQDVDLNQPLGAVAILYFSADGSTFWVEYYSTVLEKYYDLTPDTTSGMTNGKYPHERYTAHTVVYSEHRFETTVATTTAKPTDATTTVVDDNTVADTAETTAVDVNVNVGCRSIMFFGGAFAALPVIAGCSAIALRKKSKK